MREFGVRAERIDGAGGHSTGSDITALELAVVTHSTHKCMPKAYKSCMCVWGLCSGVGGGKKVIQPHTEGSWDLFTSSVIVCALLTTSWAGPRQSTNETAKVGEYKAKQLEGTQSATYTSICWHWAQQRQQLCTKATEAKQESRTVSLLELWADTKQPEGLCEGMLLIWRKKERRTVKMSKVIDSCSSHLPSLECEWAEKLNRAWKENKGVIETLLLKESNEAEFLSRTYEHYCWEGRTEQ